MSSAATTSERRWAWMAGAVLLLLTLLPIPVAIAATPAGHRFGGFVIEARDGVSYVAKAMEGLQGHLLYHDPYTSEAQPQSAIYLPYIALGQVDRVLGLPLPVVLQVARVLLAVALLQAVYLLARECLPAGRPRQVGFLLAFLGGGLGVIGHGTILGYHLVSLDRQVSGTTGLETISVAPHIVLACLACAWLALLWARHGDAPRRRDLVAALLWTLAMAAAYPQLAAMWAVVGAVAFALRPTRDRLGLALAVAVAAIPYVAYGLYLQHTNPVFAAWPPQGDIDIGDPLSYLVWGHLLMLPMVLVAAAWLRRERHRGLEVLVAWIAVSAVLMYLPGLPHLLQRVYYGSFIAFGILAAAGLSRMSRPRAARVLVPLMAVAGIVTIVEGFAIPLQHLDDLAVYVPTDEAAVLEQLRAADPAGGHLVMSSYLSGLYVPALSGEDTFVGFPFETLRTASKADAAAAYYRDPAAHQGTLGGVAYVLFGGYEAGFGGPDPGSAAGLRLIAAKGQARVYSTR